MKKHVHVSRITKDRRGRRGARILVRLENAHGRDAAPFVLDTHGRSDEEIDAAIAAGEERHRKLCARLDDFDTVRTEDLKVRGETFRIVDCTIWPRGATAVEMYVDVRRVVNGEVSGTPLAPHFPLRVLRRSVDDVPAGAEIRERVVTLIQELQRDDDEDAAATDRLARFRR